MYKVLIADDEVKVCKLISHLIDWQEYGMEIGAMVNDGMSALQYIREEKPDIVITDIRMPGYDGIELIKLAKEVDPGINFIIVSGYRQFDYAHNAIKYGVEDYLLKPLKKAEMIHTLTRMITSKEQAARGQQENVNLKQELHNDKKLFKKAFLDSLLEDRTGADTDIDREELNRNHHCNFMDGFYQGVVIKPDLPQGVETEQAYRLLMEKTEDITQKLLSEHFHEVIVTMTKEGVICLLNDSLDQLQNIRRNLKMIRNEIIKMRDVFIDVQVTIGIGEVVAKERDIPVTIQSARAANLSRYTQGTGHILTAVGNSKEEPSPYLFLEHEFRSKFLNCIELLNIEGVEELLSLTFEKLQKERNTTGVLIYSICREIYEIFSFGMGNLAVRDAMTREDFETLFHRCFSLQSLFDGLSKMISEQLETLIQERRLADKRPIRTAKKYIQEHYALPITLEEVSGEAGFNATYFSSLFKKETGQNFLEYLTDVRIKAAKQLLADTARSVNQVSEEVGYIDIKHFTKLFKKSTGLTPTEYRKLYF